MDKAAFLKSLEDELNAHSVDKEKIEECLQKYANQLDLVSPEEIEKTISDFGDIAVLVENEIALWDVIEDRTQELNTEPSEVATQEENVESPLSKDEVLPEDDTLPPVDSDDISIVSPVVYAQPTPANPSEKKSKKDKSGKVAFGILLALSIPFFLCIVFACTILFVSFFAALAALILLSAVLLVAVVIAGTILFFIGLISGIVALFDYLPIGLYELGIAFVIIGGTILIGILLYNLAVRLLPFAIKKLAALVVFVLHKIKELFYFVKKECEKI